ncbi:MAG TPA: PASTA domain-containing protein [Baekduia sp.]|nr:PASTA domain-containing protein [Baekduia sp.]
MTEQQVIDDRYELIERIGSGGMAEVYVATDRQLGRKVAIKLLHRRFAQDPEFVERFRREASSAAGLQHPHVVAVYDRGEIDDTYYIAMEYLEGRSLKQLIEDEAPVEPQRAVDLICQVLQAARFAHKRGIIHRDLKPHNVIVDDEDRAKVTDFGIARAGASDMTQTGSIMGTAQYLSPEQAQGHDVSAPSDLYSVGIMLYELLTGELPFQADSAVAIALKQVSEDPVPPAQINPGVSPELEAVVMRALEKDPSDRFQSAEEMAVALQAAARGAVVPPPASVNGAVAMPPPPPGEDRRVLPPWWPYAAAGFVAALAILIVVLLVAGGTKVAVPAVVGAPQAEAEIKLKEQGFETDVIQKNSSRPRDEVIGQSLAAGTMADKGSTVRLTVSSGPGTSNVPDLVGKTRTVARQLLKDAGFKADFIGQYSDDVLRNRVIDTRPSFGAQLDRGFAVKVIYSKGKQPVDVPDVVGKSVEDATSELESADFRVSATEIESDTEEPGTVIAQTPLGTQRAPKDSVVALTVAKEPASAKVPDVIGRTEGNALNAITAAGFLGSSISAPVTTAAEDGKVIAQSPRSGRKIKKGQRVTITVGRLDPTTTTPPPTEPVLP